MDINTTVLIGEYSRLKSFDPNGARIRMVAAMLYQSLGSRPFLYEDSMWEIRIGPDGFFLRPMAKAAYDCA